MSKEKVEKLLNELVSLVENNTKEKKEKDNLIIWSEVSKKLVGKGYLTKKEAKNLNTSELEKVIKKEKSEECIERIAFFIYKLSQVIPPLNNKFHDLSEKLEVLASSISKDKVLEPEKMEDILLFMLEIGIGSDLNKAWAEMVRAKINNETNTFDAEAIVNNVENKISDTIKKKLEKDNEAVLNKERTELMKDINKKAEEATKEWKKKIITEIYEQAYETIKKDMEENNGEVENKNEIINLLMSSAEL